MAQKQHITVDLSERERDREMGDYQEENSVQCLVALHIMSPCSSLESRCSVSLEQTKLSTYEDHE